MPETVSQITLSYMINRADSEQQGAKVIPVSYTIAKILPQEWVNDYVSKQAN